MSISHRSMPTWSRPSAVQWLVHNLKPSKLSNLNRYPAAAVGLSAAAAPSSGGRGLVLTELLPEATHLTAKSVAHLHLDSFIYNGDSEHHNVPAGSHRSVRSHRTQLTRLGLGFFAAVFQATQPPRMHCGPACR